MPISSRLSPVLTPGVTQLFKPARSAAPSTLTPGTGSGPGPALMFSPGPGALSLRPPGYTEAEMIATIVQGQTAPAVPNPFGLVTPFAPLSEDIQGRLDQAVRDLAGVNYHVGVKVIGVDGGKGQYGSDYLHYVGEGYAQKIIDHADKVATSDEKAYQMVEKFLRRTARRADKRVRDGTMTPAKGQRSKDFLKAYENGKLELVDVAEFGVIRKKIETFQVFEGSYAGGGSYSRVEYSGPMTLDALRAERVVEQADGTKIDPETGRQSGIIIFGGRAFMKYINE